MLNLWKLITSAVSYCTLYGGGKGGGGKKGGKGVKEERHKLGKESHKPGRPKGGSKVRISK